MYQITPILTSQSLSPLSLPTSTTAEVNHKATTVLLPNNMAATHSNSSSTATVDTHNNRVVTTHRNSPNRLTEDNLSKGTTLNLRLSR